MLEIEPDEPADDSPLSERVVTAVAEARDVDPLDLPPLYDVIDLDALDDLFTGGSGEAAATPDRVVFTFAGQEITVCRDGDVTVTGPAGYAGPSFAAEPAGERGEVGYTDD